MKVDKKKRFALLLITPLLISMQFIIGYYISQRILHVNELEDRHTKMELYFRNQLMSLVNAETGQRGFLLTDNPQYLAPYNLGLRQLSQNDTLLKDLKVLVETQQFEGLQHLTRRKLEIMEQTITLSSTGKKDSALAIVNTNDGLFTMDSIRHNIDSYLLTVFVSVEDAREELQRLIYLFVVVMVGMLFFQLVFSFYVYATFVRFSNSIIDLINDLEVKNSSLKEFTFMSYHQLREPLRSISGFIQLLGKKNEEKLDQESKEFIQEAIKATNQMNSTINSLREEHLSRTK